MLFAIWTNIFVGKLTIRYVQVHWFSLGIYRLWMGEPYLFVLVICVLCYIQHYICIRFSQANLESVVVSALIVSAGSSSLLQLSAFLCG